MGKDQPARGWPATAVGWLHASWQVQARLLPARQLWAAPQEPCKTNCCHSAPLQRPSRSGPGSASCPAGLLPAQARTRPPGHLQGHRSGLPPPAHASPGLLPWSRVTLRGSCRTHTTSTGLVKSLVGDTQSPSPRKLQKLPSRSPVREPWRGDGAAPEA